MESKLGSPIDCHILKLIKSASLEHTSRVLQLQESHLQTFNLHGACVQGHRCEARIGPAARCHSWTDQLAQKPLIRLVVRVRLHTLVRLVVDFSG